MQVGVCDWPGLCFVAAPMQNRVPKTAKTPPKLARIAVFLTLTASCLALAQAAPQIGRLEEGDSGSKAAWRGSSLSYGVASTVTTFVPSYELHYNPTVEHRLGFMPEWHFNDDFAVRARFFLSQELTASDSTNTLHEVELSDLWLDGVWSGWKESVTGLKVSSTLRLMVPTSKSSRMQSRILTVGPGVAVSRLFPVLSGLSLSYAGRFTWRFNRFATSQNQGASIAVCGLTGAEDCPSIVSSGVRSMLFDVFHGPTVAFLPHPRVTLSVAFFMQDGYLPALSESPLPLTRPELEGPRWRHYWGSSLSADYQAFDAVGFSLGLFTFSNQLAADSSYHLPLFNRYTVVSLDTSVDVEALIRKLTNTREQS